MQTGWIEHHGLWKTGRLIYTISERPVVARAMLLLRLLQSRATVRSALVFQLIYWNENRNTHIAWVGMVTVSVIGIIYKMNP